MAYETTGEEGDAPAGPGFGVHVVLLVVEEGDGVGVLFDAITVHVDVEDWLAVSEWIERVRWHAIVAVEEVVWIEVVNRRHGEL